MTDRIITEDVKRSFQAKLQELAHDLHLGRIEIGRESSVIATAVVEGLRTTGFTIPILRIGAKEDFLVVETRHLTYRGCRGHLANKTVVHFLTNLLLPGLSGDLDADKILLLTLTGKAFFSETHTVDDLIALVVSASNDALLLTRACIDFRDGETYVDRTTPWDGNCLPEDFELTVRRVLEHATMIIRFTHSLREEVFPQADRHILAVLSAVFDKLSEQENDQTT